MYSRTFTGRWKTVHANGSSCCKERIIGKFKTMEEANEEALALWNHMSKQPHANTHMVRKRTKMFLQKQNYSLVSNINYSEYSPYRPLIDLDPILTQISF